MEEVGNLTERIQDITGKIKYLAYDRNYFIDIKRGDIIRLTENKEGLSSKKDILEGEVKEIIYDPEPWKHYQKYKKQFLSEPTFFLVLESRIDDSINYIEGKIIEAPPYKGFNTLYLPNYLVDLLEKCHVLMSGGGGGNGGDPHPEPLSCSGGE